MHTSSDPPASQHGESASALPLLYQASLFSDYASRMIAGFTGKPVSFGGPDLSRDDALAARRQFCQALGMDFSRLAVPSQTHSDHVQRVCGENLSDTDAIIVDKTGYPAFIQTADCVPLIFYDPVRHVGAVIHAGWRGTSKSIAVKTVKKLLLEHGVARKDLRVAIGPAIRSCCYEVSIEVLDAVAVTLPSILHEAFATYSGQSVKPHVDLQSVNAHQLFAMDIDPDHVEILPHCTRCSTNELWSYRRGEAGRQIAYLQLL